MRIVAGKYRGVPLYEFEGYEVRPTSDRAKESLFNILQFSIVGKSFLDLFCGSGSIGIEAISRGAERVVFTDGAKKSVELTRKNLSKIKENRDVILTDAIAYLSTVREKFDYIFIDPPYNSEVGEKALQIIDERKLLKNGGKIIFEKDSEIKLVPLGLEVVDVRKYGKAYLTFITAKE